jgi:putative phosphoesterase
MRIATFSDIHGNWHALQAVLADIDSQKPDQVYCLGDLVGYGAYPNEVIDLVRSRGIPTVMGNYDDGVGFDKDECGCAYTDPEMRRLGDLSLRWMQAHVPSDNKAYLRSLAPHIRLEAEGRRILLVHGSPRRINGYLYEDRPLSSLEHVLQGAACDILFCGHTHLPYVRDVAGVRLVNDGSAGKPKDGDPRAAYALLEVGAGVAITIRRVPYDVQAAVAAVRASGLPAHFAELLEAARG